MSWLVIIVNDDPGIQKFVIDHFLLVGGSTSAVFGTGCAVGRFLFDRAVLSLRSAAEDFERERDSAREEREDLKRQLEQAKQVIQTRPDFNGEGATKYVRGRRQVARAHIVSRLLSALLGMMLLGAAVYVVHEVRLLRVEGASEKSLIEFSDKSNVEFRELKEKLKAPTKPPSSNKRAIKERVDGAPVGSSR
jgi:hypothetical protein